MGITYVKYYGNKAIRNWARFDLVKQTLLTIQERSGEMPIMSWRQSQQNLLTLWIWEVREAGF